MSSVHRGAVDVGAMRPDGRYCRICEFETDLTEQPLSSSRRESAHHRGYGQGVVWSGLNTLSLQGSTFAVNVVLANILGKQQFGEFGIMQTTLLTFATIAQLATGVTATKYIAELRDTDAGKAGRLIGLCFDVTFFFGVVGVAVLLTSAGWLSEVLWNAPHLQIVVVLGSAFVLFTAMNGYQMGALAGLGAYKALASASLIQAPVYILACILFGWQYGVAGAVSAFALTATIRWVIYGYVLKKELRRSNLHIDRQHAWRERSILWTFTLPAAVAGLTTMPAIWLANSFLARQPGGFSELGVYAAAVVIKNIILQLPQVFNSVGITFLNNRLGAGDGYNFWRLFRLNLIVSMVGVITGIVFLVLAGRWIMGLFGQSFASGYHVLLILLLSALFEALAISIYQIIQSSGRMWLSFFGVALPRDLLFVSLAIALAPEYGAAGVASAYAIAWFVALCIIAVMARVLRGTFAFQ